MSPDPRSQNPCCALGPSRGLHSPGGTRLERRNRNQEVEGREGGGWGRNSWAHHNLRRLQLPPAQSLETGNAEALARRPGHYPSAPRITGCGPPEKDSVTFFAKAVSKRASDMPLQQPGRKIQCQREEWMRGIITRQTAIAGHPKPGRRMSPGNSPLPPTCAWSSRGSHWSH